MTAACLDCGAAGAEPVLGRADLSLVRCPACSLVYLADWEDELGRFDEHYAYFDARRGAGSGPRVSPLNRARLEEFLDELAQAAPGRRLLDVGCGEGHLVEAACDRGWLARGIDLSGPAVELCAERGLPVSRTDFFSPELDGSRYDAIVMSELIEHVPRPRRFVARAASLLDDGGILYLTTPNFASLSRRLHGASWRMIHPQHVGYFTPSTLRSLADDRLELVEIATRNLSLGEIGGAVRRLVRRSARTAPPSESARRSAYAADQRVRRVLRESPLGRVALNAANLALGRSSLGDTIVATLRRRPDRSSASSRADHARAARRGAER
jgi:SAM-dependent methyltransferase